MDAGQIDSQMHLTLWPAAKELCDQLGPYINPNSTVLELGAGTGLVGLYASKVSSQVRITDGNPESVELIQENISNNLSNATCEVLQWGTDVDQYDLVICSDVIYSERAVEPLVRTICSAIRNGGVCLLANHVARLSSYESFFVSLCSELRISLKLLPSQSFKDIKTYLLTLNTHN